MSNRVAALVLPAMIILFCSEGFADTINQNVGMSTVAISGIDPIGQTFPWTTDPGLGSIGFTFGNLNPTFPNQPVTVTLYAGAGFSGTALRSVTQTLPVDLPGPTEPGLPIDFDFSGLALIPGIYTAAVTTGSSPRIGLKHDRSNPYPDGAMVFTGTFPGALCISDGACDLQFRVTPASVAEPTSFSLFLGGLLSIPGIVRLKRNWR